MPGCDGMRCSRALDGAPRWGRGGLRFQAVRVCDDVIYNDLQRTIYSYYHAHYFYALMFRHRSLSVLVACTSASDLPPGVLAALRDQLTASTSSNVSFR